MFGINVSIRFRHPFGMIIKAWQYVMDVVFYQVFFSEMYMSAYTVIHISFFFKYP